VTVRDNNGTPGNPADDFNATFVGGDANANGLLGTNENSTVIQTLATTPGQHTNVTKASGTPPTGGPPVTDTEPYHHFGSVTRLTLVTLIHGPAHTAPPGPFVPVVRIVPPPYFATFPYTTLFRSVTVRDNNGTPGNPADDFNATFVGGDGNANGLL